MTKTYQERIAHLKAKHPNWSSLCRNSGHLQCKGYRGKNRTAVCECYCHMHICPRCKQPSEAATRGRLMNASLKIQQIANDLTKELSQ